MKPFPLFVVVALSLVGSRVFGSFTTLVDNGPSSNRVDIVFLGDGYTTVDIAAGTYDNHINGYLNYMFSNTLRSFNSSGITPKSNPPASENAVHLLFW